MDRDVGRSKKNSLNITFNVSDASSDEDVIIATTGIKSTSFAKPSDVTYRKQRNEIKNELFNLSKEINLVIIVIYGMYCFNWYLMGIQWLPEPSWKPEIECEITDLSEVDWSFYEKRNITSPDEDAYLPGCTYYDYDYLSLSKLTYEAAHEQAIKAQKNTQILTCKKYRIEHDIPKEITHTREFNMFCMKRSWQFTKVYMHMGACIFGFPAGILADIYGRRSVHVYCAVLFCLSAFAISFSTDFIMFAVLTVIRGGTLYSINITLVLELYRNKFRTFLLMVSFSWWHIGYQLTEDIYNIVEVWRLRKLIVALLILIFVFVALMITPESPRLLMANRQFKTAWEWLRELGSSESSDVQNFEPPKVNLKYQLTVFAKLLLQQRTYIAIFLNVTGSFFMHFFFGNLETWKRNIIKLSTRLRLQFLLIQVMLIFFTAGLTFVYSRKTALCIYYILMSLCILTNMFVTNIVITDVAGHAGNMFAGVLFILSYTYILETFPTSHRATCMGFYLTSNKLLHVLLEIFVYDMFVWEHKDLFPTIYCGICMICALITSLLPESYADIPDRMEDFLK